MSKNSSLNIGHDAFIKKVLSNKAAVKSFLRQFLPDNVLSLLDIDGLKKNDKSFITEVLRQRFADIVYTVPLKDSYTGVQVSMLIEHTSSPDKFVIFQILEYLAVAYRSQTDNDEPPQLIIPIVYYHGEEKWESRELASFFTEFPKDLQIYVPDFDHIFVDLSKLTMEQISHLEDSLLQTALRIQFLSFLKGIDARLLLEAFEIFDHGRYRNYFRAVLVYTYKYLDINDQEFEDFITELPDPIKTEAMTIAERLEKRGIEKGIEKGITQTRVEIILQSYENGLNISMISKITKLSGEEIKKILSDNGK